MDRDLFGNQVAPTLSASRRRKKDATSAYAWPPGSGPLNKTCGECVSCVRVHQARTRIMCALVPKSTTDIRPGAPACLKWEPRK